MKSTTVLTCALLLALCALLFADRSSSASVSPAWEMKALLPQEVSPGRYIQVPNHDLDRMAAAGWQLVSVTAYVILNEERGPEGRKTAVTQTYPGYFFQRPKPPR